MLAPGTAYVIPVRVRVWLVRGCFPGSDLRLKFVAASLARGGRCFSRCVSGDGDHTDVFSSPRSTKCPVELRCETSKHCENEDHSTKKHVLGYYHMGNFSLETSLCLKIMRSLYKRNLEVGIFHFLYRLQDGMAKSI